MRTGVSKFERIAMFRIVAQRELVRKARESLCYDLTQAMKIRISLLFIIYMMCTFSARAAAPGKIALDVMGEQGAGAKVPANIVASDGHVVATVAAGSSTEVAPGEYRVELPLIGGKIVKNGISVESGRTHTVVVDNVGVLEVSVKDKTGKDPGFQVTVTSSAPPHDKVAGFLSGDRMLFAPTQVNVHVDAPPQGYDWHDVALPPGHRARLTLDEVVPGELDVQAELAKASINEASRVVIYRAGTQA